MKEGVEEHRFAKMAPAIRNPDGKRGCEAELFVDQWLSVNLCDESVCDMVRNCD